MDGLLIGELAERAGVSATTVRYYESIGLLKPPARSPSGYRRYPERTVDELRFIRKAQSLAFSLEEVAQILKLSRSGQVPCSHVLSLAHQHLAAVDERIGRLQTFRDQLAGELARWEHQQQPAVTCEGFCQFIADAPDVSEGTLQVERPSRDGRPRGAR